MPGREGVVSPGWRLPGLRGVLRGVSPTSPPRSGAPARSAPPRGLSGAPGAAPASSGARRPAPASGPALAAPRLSPGLDLLSRGPHAQPLRRPEKCELHRKSAPERRTGHAQKPGLALGSSRKRLHSGGGGDFGES